MPTPREIAEAFSSHRFDEALPHVASDAEWTLVGADVLLGAAAIIDACRSTEAELAGGVADVTRFDVVDGGDLIAIDTETTYADAVGGAVTVASCDLYTFRDGRIVGIRSYAVDVS